MLEKAKPDHVAGPAGKSENRGWPFLTSPLAPVNPSRFLFHVQPLAGLVLAGGWCDRLILWLPMVMAKSVLRDAVGGRI